jgi:hypothetical protein
MNILKFMISFRFFFILRCFLEYFGAPDALFPRSQKPAPVRVQVRQEERDLQKNDREKDSNVVGDLVNEKMCYA